MILRQLTFKDSDQLEKLISVIEDSIENHLWWLPINETSREHFVDPEWCYFVGIFDGNELVAAFGLFFYECEIGGSLKKLRDVLIPCAKIGRRMVNLFYLGHTLLL